MMRKRERENPCEICEHHHNYADGEPCAVCGHRLIEGEEKVQQHSAFSTEILPGFLYLGSYDNASRAEILRAQGINCILNTVPSCQNLYRKSFSYYCVKDDKGGTSIPFDDCEPILGGCNSASPILGLPAMHQRAQLKQQKLALTEQAGHEKQRVLVHCMSGQNRSPAVVISFLMHHKQWRLPESYLWVKERRPSTSITVAKQLQEYETQIFGDSAATLLVENLGGIDFSFRQPAQAVLQPELAALSSHGTIGPSSPSLLTSSNVPHNPFTSSTFNFGSKGDVYRSKEDSIQQDTTMNS
eukprot:SM000058S18580  [mRNA]  locus=s58:730068:731713:- [translate_table: standard]